MTPLRYLIALTLMIPSAVAALPGAAQTLQEIQSAAQAAPPSDQDSPEATFKQELTNFSTSSAQLTPPAAAKKWIELIQTWNQLKPEQRHSYSDSRESGFESLIQVVPPPAAWEEIQKLLQHPPTQDALSDSLLALFAATLMNDEAAKWKAFQAFQKLGKSRDSGKQSGLLTALIRMAGIDGVSQQMGYLTNQIARPLMQLSDNPEHILAALETQLAGYNKSASSGFDQFSIPDLVTLLGETKARAFLLKALTAPVELQVQGTQTLDLARTLALEFVDKLQAPQWSLVTGIDSSNLKLYEALIQKFPRSDSSDHSRKEATGNYIFALIANGQTKAAAKLVQEATHPEGLELPHDAIYAMIRAGYRSAVMDFLYALLEKNPNLPFWDDYLSLAAQERKTATALELAQKSLEAPSLTKTQRIQLLGQLGSTYLAHGEIEKGIATLQEALKQLKADSSPDYSEISSKAISLAQIGRLMGNTPLFESSLNEAIAAQKLMESSYSNGSLLELLAESGRALDARQLVVQSLEKQLRGQGDHSQSTLSFPSELTQLAGLYDAANQPAEVLKLLTLAPWWGEKDLGEIADHMDYRRIPLGLMAARALLAAGQRDEARKALHVTLRKTPTADAAYAMLVELDGAAALPFLEEQFSRDRFQERPLIWKAALLLKAKKLDEAAVVIRQAIAIDPSDGEMGSGDRMRAYAVLADILQAKGQGEDAALYRSAVQAIRLSEEADQYQTAGLLTEAVNRHEKALTLFADAYCIQSRLAIQFMELGDVKKAEMHYLKAYELMPDSFGRMESHCFGCERAFKGELAETLAEKTFQKLLAENPSKPQLHYLLGYLRSEQERYSEALKHFLKAVELDPDYINAWKEIIGLSQHIALPPALRDEATLTLLRLDPFGRHGRSGLGKVGDLKKMWAVLEELRATLPPEPPADFFPLTASAALLPKSEPQTLGHRGYQSMMDSDGQIPTPREVLREHELLQPISEILTQLRDLNQE